MVETNGAHLDKKGLTQPGALVAHGTVYPRQSAASPVLRMLDMCGALEDFMRQHKPKALVIEQHGYRTMGTIATVENLAFISTILIHRAKEKHGIRSVGRMGVATIKRLASGDGGATKDTVEAGVTQFFNLSHTVITDNNHSDALGMAMAWLVTGGNYKKPKPPTKGKKK